jgi:hypothetical protein
MRQIETAHGGKKWHCIASIEATHRDVKARDAFSGIVKRNSAGLKPSIKTDNQGH